MQIRDKMKAMHYRTQKQVIIALFTLVFLSLAVFTEFFLFRGEQKPQSAVQAVPTQAPERAFKDIEVVFAEFFSLEDRDKTYDIIGEIKNPNLEYGSPSVVYEFVFSDKEGREIKRISGSSFILANQARYIIKQAIRLAAEPARLELKILSQTWKRLGPFDASGLKVDDLKIRRDESLGRTYLTGLVRNLTPYNLKEIEVNAALSRNKEIIAAGATNLQLINRGTARSFQMLWPAILPYVDANARVESNFFENDNFVRDYGR